jgi:hypothetical protein
MSVPTTWPTTPSAQSAARGLLIVARDQRDVYDCLQHTYGDSERIIVLLDRRQGERRHPSTIAEDLRFQQYVLVRPHDRRPHD